MIEEKPYLGIIEGFYGEPWSWSARSSYASFLADNGFSFYIYAPKGDASLRKSWDINWTEEVCAALQHLRKEMRSRGIHFGIGLSPYELYRDYLIGGSANQMKRRFCEKVSYIESSLQPDIFCILFDDMRGDVQDMIRAQVQICEDAGALTHAARKIVCPTYYSLDPYLEKHFGAAPDRYLETLGRDLAANFDVFWTGPETFSKDFPREHLEWVTERLRRRPFIWDNYPVNDADTMCGLLRLKPFSNRRAELKDLSAGHAVNPLKQPWLSQIPLVTLPLCYSKAVLYAEEEAFNVSLMRVCPAELAAMISRDIEKFSSEGLEGIPADERSRLIADYSQLSEDPRAHEIIRWLRNEYAFDPTLFEG